VGFELNYKNIKKRSLLTDNQRMKYMKIIRTGIILLSIMLLPSCGNNNSAIKKGIVPTVSQSKSFKKESNAISQSLPTLMVLPSDGLLQKLGCLSSFDNQGVTSYKRDYSKALINSGDLKFVIAAIEEEFANVGYPLENLEQQLKMVGNENAMDLSEGVARDLRTELMNTARPDYIIELEYDMKIDPKSRNLEKSLTYIVKCLDSYTNKAISVITRADVGKGSGNSEIAPIIKKDFPEAIKELQSTITSNYSDILSNGAEITLRIGVLEKAGLSLDDNCGDEKIGEQVINWLKANSVKSTYKMVKNTTTEMRFTNVRIFTKDQSGNSYRAYDFAKDFKNAIGKACGLSITNRTHSICDSFIQIGKLK